MFPGSYARQVRSCHCLLPYFLLLSPLVLSGFPPCQNCLILSAFSSTCQGHKSFALEIQQILLTRFLRRREITAAHDVNSVFAVFSTAMNLPFR